LKPHFSVYLKINQKREHLLPFLRQMSNENISECIPAGDSNFILCALFFVLSTAHCPLLKLRTSDALAVALEGFSLAKIPV
jgi:hypothetical protein